MAGNKNSGRRKFDEELKRYALRNKVIMKSLTIADNLLTNNPDSKVAVALAGNIALRDIGNSAPKETLKIDNRSINISVDVERLEAITKRIERLNADIGLDDNNVTDITPQGENVLLDVSAQPTDNKLNNIKSPQEGLSLNTRTSYTNDVTNTNEAIDNVTQCIP